MAKKKTRPRAANNSETGNGHPADAAKTESSRIGQFIQSFVFDAPPENRPVRIVLRHMPKKNKGNKDRIGQKIGEQDIHELKKKDIGALAIGLFTAAENDAIGLGGEQGYIVLVYSENDLATPASRCIFHVSPESPLRDLIDVNPAPTQEFDRREHHSYNVAAPGLEAGLGQLLTILTDVMKHEQAKDDSRCDPEHVKLEQDRIDLEKDQNCLRWAEHELRVREFEAQEKEREARRQESREREGRLRDNQERLD